MTKQSYELNEQQIENLLNAFVELQKQQKIIAEKITAIKDTLKLHADEVGMNSGDFFMGITLKSRYDDIWRDKFDSKALEKAMPDLYNQFLRVGYTHAITVNNPQLL